MSDKANEEITPLALHHLLTFFHLLQLVAVHPLQAVLLLADLPLVLLQSAHPLEDRPSVHHAFPSVDRPSDPLVPLMVLPASCQVLQQPVLLPPLTGLAEVSLHEFQQAHRLQLG